MSGKICITWSDELVFGVDDVDWQDHDLGQVEEVQGLANLPRDPASCDQLLQQQGAEDGHVGVWKRSLKRLMGWLSSDCKHKTLQAHRML